MGENVFILSNILGPVTALGAVSETEGQVFHDVKLC